MLEAPTRDRISVKEGVDRVFVRTYSAKSTADHESSESQLVCLFWRVWIDRERVGPGCSRQYL